MMNFNGATVGKKIRELRKKSRITQTALGQALGVSKSSVAMWETDKRSPDLETVKRLSDFFSVSMEYFISGEATLARGSIIIVQKDGSHKRYSLNDEQLAAVNALVETLCDKDE